jgi:ABC-type multidrug transport system fused ATPase/permease subunit
MTAASWKMAIKAKLGLDRAIVYMVLARGFGTLGSVAIVLLITRYLTPSQQGYYYTIWSLVALQPLFEMGFSLVILQMAAHERVHLDIDAFGRVMGDSVARARLASVLQKALRWYGFASGLLIAILLPIGTFFFWAHHVPGQPHQWLWPWITAVLACSLTFFLAPLQSFYEGCGFVAQVAGMRLRQSILATLFACAALFLGYGLFAPSLVMTGQLVAAGIFFWRRRGLVLGLLGIECREHAVSWGREIWPFQWKIAVSWLCSYSTGQFFTPLVFAVRGPVEAGKMGLCMNIVSQLAALALPWFETKAAPFGGLVARREFAALDALFIKTLRQASILFGAGLACVFGGVIAVQSIAPSIANRMLAPSVFLLLLLTAFCNYIIQGMAYYLRSFKREPFLHQSIIIAFLTLLFGFIFGHSFGSAGIAASYFVCSGIFGLTSSSFIFLKFKNMKNVSLKFDEIKKFEKSIC